MPLHVIDRGNNRMECFWSDRDRRLYLALLTELADLHRCSVHAYVLMTNHVHLLLTPERSDSPALLMKALGQRYTQFVNRRYGRSGTLWEGRFRSGMIDSVRYLLCCQRYIELNPVRAGLVAQPWEYEWSSYHANAMGRPSDLLVPHAEYLALGHGIADRMRSYRDLFREALSPVELNAIRNAVKGGHPLGPPDFVTAIDAQLQRHTAPRAAGRPPRSQRLIELDCTE